MGRFSLDFFGANTFSTTSVTNVLAIETNMERLRVISKGTIYGGGNSPFVKGLLSNYLRVQDSLFFTIWGTASFIDAWDYRLIVSLFRAKSLSMNFNYILLRGAIILYLPTTMFSRCDVVLGVLWERGTLLPNSIASCLGSISRVPRGRGRTNKGC